ncbi:MAG: hypothetical protein ACYTGH_04485, partial [Planctomycetota bacterium]
SWSERICDVTDGYALGVVLDHNYVEWARGFLARARKRLNMRGKKALEFVLSYIELEDGSRVLAVSVYPKVKKAVELPAREALESSVDTPNEPAAA